MLLVNQVEWMPLNLHEGGQTKLLGEGRKFPEAPGSQKLPELPEDSHKGG